MHELGNELLVMATGRVRKGQSCYCTRSDTSDTQGHFICPRGLRWIVLFIGVCAYSGAPSCTLHHLFRSGGRATSGWCRIGACMGAGA